MPPRSTRSPDPADRSRRAAWRPADLDRRIRLDWNPLARRLESPACEFSRAAGRPRLACDDALHLVTAEGLAPCAGCGKAFCRACHRARCPKCGTSAPRPD